MLSDSPPERDLEWTDAGIDGAWRYLNRLWRLVDRAARALAGAATVAAELDPALMDAARAPSTRRSPASTDDLERFHFNKAVARIRELTNRLGEVEGQTAPAPPASCARRWRRWCG